MADIDQLLIKAEEMRRKPPYKAVLIELMNVLLFQSTEEVPFHKNTLKSILCCGATVDYQCGRMTQDQYFDRVAIDFKHPRKDVESALLSLRKSTRIDTDLLKTLAVIKAEQYPKISFYAAANLSKDDYAFVSALGFDWSLFDGVHLSWKQRMRKPELQFYRHVLEAIDVEPDEAILVDRVTDNILAALSFGFKDVFRLKDPLSRQIVDTFKFDPSNKGIPLQKQISQALFTLKPASSGKYEDILQSAVARGAQFLDQNAKNFPSLTLTGVPVRENFSQLLILEITGDRDLIDIEVHDYTWNYFIGTPVLTQSDFPDDIDTTSLGTTILDSPACKANHIMDLMLRYLSPDGIIQTYFTDMKNRVDPVVCCNALSLFYQYGRGDQLSTTLAFVRQVLKQRAYLYGTSFYPVPETFFFFLSRFLRRLQQCRDPIYHEMRCLLAERVKERIGVPVDAANLAMRLTVCHELDIPDVNGLRDLISMQETDGGWDMGILYSYASKNLPIGNRGLCTALTLDAVGRCQSWSLDFN